MRRSIGGARVAAVILAMAAAAAFGAASAAEQAADPLETALASPQATGLLVIGLADGQSLAAGVREGEILVRYDGVDVATVEALSAAKEAVGEKTEVACDFVAPDGSRRTVTLAPGSLGLQLAPVAEGRAPSPLPADTGAVLSADGLPDVDDWLAFSFGDGPDVGLEHVRVRVRDGVLHLEHEVAFDGGETWGLHHAHVTASIRLGTTPEPVALSYLNPLNGWRSDATLGRDEGGRAVWEVVMGPPDARERSRTALRRDVAAVPTYVVLQMARLLPQEEGACFVFRPVSDWDGKPGLRSALVCTGTETLRVDGAEVVTWRYVQRNLAGQESGAYWFDAARRLVRATYGGPVATRTTKEKALALVDAARFTLRTAD